MNINKYNQFIKEEFDFNLDDIDNFWKRYQPDSFRRKPRQEYEKGEITVDVLRGDDILRTFNYENEINTERMRFSCCNFNMQEGYKNNIKPEQFDFYSKNPKSSGSITLFENGEICGRASFFEGENLFDNGNIKKGQYYKFVNEPYLYEERRYNDTLNDWMEKNGYVYINDLMVNKIFIPFNTRVTPQYPPLDGITVNIKDNILCSNNIYRYNKIEGVDPYDYHIAYNLNIVDICRYLRLKIG